MIVPFEFERFSVRIIIDDEGEYKDVADVLGYADTAKAIKQHCRGAVKRLPIPDALGRLQDTRVLSEPDTFRLIVGSQMPNAQTFERKVFEEILPTIRKTGSYHARPQTTGEMLVQMAMAYAEHEKQILALQTQQAQQAQAIEAIEAIEAKQRAIEMSCRDFSIMAYANLHNIPIDLRTAALLGKRVAAKSRSRNLPMGKLRDPRFGKLNTYSEAEEF